MLISALLSLTHLQQPHVAMSQPITNMPAIEQTLQGAIGLEENNTSPKTGIMHAPKCGVKASACRGSGRRAVL